MFIQFPKDFIWGCATASYQVEGAVDEDGRGPSIWDVFSHKKGNIVNDDTGDVACDHYHLYKSDVRLMKELGISSYRFSIAWSRIYPDASGKVNKKGLQFYEELVDELIANGIEPIITLYHWDLPQWIQEEGGWAGPTVVDHFVTYARTVFDALGKRVKKWITHNEPWVVAFVGHYAGRHAPGHKDLSEAVRASHNLILSHSKTVLMFREMLGNNGEIGITLNLYPVDAATDSPEDRAAARFVDGYHNRWFLDPVYKGKYPEDIYAFFNKEAGFSVPDRDMEIIARAGADFLGINYYFRRVVRKADTDGPFKYEEIMPVGQYTDMGWEIYPYGLYQLLKQLKDDYGNPCMFITENGMAYGEGMDKEARLRDRERIDFLKGHFLEAVHAISDGVRLEGYYAWSLLDNFEWGFGHSKRFGIIDVDYATQERTWKDSAYWYRKVVGQNGLEE